MNLYDASPQTTTEETKYRKPSLGRMCRPSACSLTQDLRHAQATVEELRAQLEQLQADHEKTKAELEHVQGVRRKYQQMLFGSQEPPSKSSAKPTAEEASRPSDAVDADQVESRKRRGAQKGHRGAGRKIPKGLPIHEIVHEVPEQDAICPRCDKPYTASGLCEESYEVAMEIRFYLKKHIRPRVFRSCHCDAVPRQITAAKPANIIPKGLYDHSLLAFLLYGKYGMQVALTRLISLMAAYGLCVQAGTIAGIFKKITKYLQPLYQLLQEQLQEEAVLYIDETGFRHFLAPEVQTIPDDQRPGKLSWLWVYAGERVTVFTVEVTRSSQVLEQTLGRDAQGIILMSDGAPAYRRFVSLSKVLHSRCWAHFRRHFEDAATKFPVLQAWTCCWLERIAELYTLNAQRLNALDATSRAQAQVRLEQAIEQFHQMLTKESRQADIHDEAWKVLTSGLKYWEAYTVFVDHPEVAMDNNLAERSLRPGVLGRQNWYGVHAPWSGTLAAMMMSLIQTAQQHGLNPAAYLHYLLDEAAQWQGQPRDLAKYLPWNLDDAVCIAYSMKTGSDPP